MASFLSAFPHLLRWHYIPDYVALLACRQKALPNTIKRYSIRQQTLPKLFTQKTVILSSGLMKCSRFQNKKRS